MEYRIETWTIKKLLDKYNKKKLDLNPSYQRRFIWSLKDQQTLINSMIKGYAIPNIFLFEKKQEEFEMVDGQQRTRTILGFINEQFKTFDGKLYSKKEFENLVDYQIAVIIIEKIEIDENIEDFYALVNKAGVNLNRPELKKAEYFETNFLKLVTEIAASDKFKSLDLFTEITSKRMVDVDFVSELVTLLIEGNTDKKITVDRKFEKDITISEYTEYLKSFDTVLDCLNTLNSIYPIKKTRYKQRNDFYTLVGFVNNINSTKQETINYFYELLLKFNEHITPSNLKCLPFQNYAFHCVSQSNSKVAREARLKIFELIFLNEKSIPNKIQKDILKYFHIDKEPLIKKEKFYTIDISKL
ncbi:MAG: DUF262 domain-containing protein [Bacteroidetes bacterium]|nr:MAG: DUF262 domain-containing protein [Bacteroidota bacterium]